MSAESTLHTALVGYADLSVLVDIRVYDTKFPTVKPGQRDISFPCCVFQRVFTTKEQAITGVVVSRSPRFQITCHSESSVEATAVALQVENALVAAIGSFADVTLRNESADYDSEVELFSRIVEADCLEAA